MCRPKSEGGRRCPGSHSGSSGPPADGKTRIEVHTSKRSYSVIGGESKVEWMPGERVVSMDVIDPGKPGGSEAAGSAGGNGEEEEYAGPGSESFRKFTEQFSPERRAARARFRESMRQMERDLDVPANLASAS